MLYQHEPGYRVVHQIEAQSGEKSLLSQAIGIGIQIA